jgi:MSHA biogenesis protein MshN
MSVINKMLRDLDDRGGLGPRNFEEGIHDVERVARQPAEESRPWGKVIAGVAGIAVVLAAGAWYFLQPGAPARVAQSKPAPPPAQPGPAAAATPAAPKPAPAEPTPAPPAPAPVASTPPPAAAVTVTQAPPPPAPAPKKAEPAPQAGMLAIPAAARESVAASNTAIAKREEAVKATPLRTEPAKVELAKVEAPAPKPAPPKAEPIAKAEAPPPKPAPAKAEPPPQVAAAAPSSSEPQGRISIDRGNRSTLTGTPRANAEYRSANDLLAQNRVEAAIGRYADALGYDPRHVQARQSLVVLLLEQGRVAEAEGLIREGITLVPQQASWPMLLARMQVQAGDAKGALETLERSAPNAQGNAEYHAFLATLMQMQGRHREAIGQYEASLKASPESGRALAGLAISLEQEQRIPEAREAYRRAQAASGLGRELEAYVERKVKQLQ